MTMQYSAPSGRLEMILRARELSSLANSENFGDILAENIDFFTNEFAFGAPYESSIGKIFSQEEVGIFSKLMSELHSLENEISKGNIDEIDESRVIPLSKIAAELSEAMERQ